MKKILIYFQNDLKPIGGPCGYLYSLINGLERIEQESIQVHLLPSNGQLNSVKTMSKNSKNAIINFCLKKFRRIKWINSIFRVLYKDVVPPVNLDDYDAVHFHATRELYMVRKSLENYRGKVILTSHSPQPQSLEYRDIASPIELKLLKKQFDSMMIMDKYSLMRADYIVFPCEFSDEPYINSWKEYLNIKAVKRSSYRYMLSGTVKPNIKSNKEEVRKKYKIPNNAFLISYVGRHNSVKGYDKFIEICMQILDKHNDVYVIVAGSQGAIPHPDHPRWIEIGWTNDPHSITNASDVFILPNKETYFDLIMLELLSIGVIVVASNTGGNKYFTDEKGVIIYNSAKECIDIIEKLMHESDDEILERKQSNIELYYRKFTVESFAERYVELIESIFRE